MNQLFFICAVSKGLNFCKLAKKIMGKFTFGKSPSQKLERLIFDFEKYKNGELDTQTAMSLSVDAWHLTDWVYSEYKQIHEFTDLGAFRDSLYPNCEHLKIMHDLANSAKHSETSRPKANIQEASEYEGVYSFEYSNEYDTSRIEIKLDTDEILDFNDVIEEVIIFWINYFQIHLGISIT
jgi:hypothetical protein